jgi:hypothetical protein
MAEASEIKETEFMGRSVVKNKYQFNRLYPKNSPTKFRKKLFL